jgi:hypothetical protein
MDNQRRVVYRREVDELDRTRIRIPYPLRNTERETGLAYSTSTQERQ